MMAANYQHIGGHENRLGRHYSRFRRFGHPQPLPINHLLCEKSQNAGSNGRSRASYRDVEELLAERGLDISYESVRSWVLKFGPAIARGLRRCRPRPSDRWHLDEMVGRIAGKRMDLWRAVDHEGEVLEILVQRRRDRSAAVKLMRKLLRKQGFAPAR